MEAKYNQSSIRSISIIIPLYNEEEAIEQLHARLGPVLAQLQRQWKLQLILVNDGSVDKTHALLLQHFGQLEGVEVLIIEHVENRGIGAAMRTGFKVASGDIVCTMDSDCTYAPEKMPEMIEMLLDGDVDIVTASPYHPLMFQTEQSHRFFLSKMASRMYSEIVPIKLYCYTSFFRVYRRDWARPDLFESEGFLAVTEALLAAVYCGARILEFPTRLNLRTCGRSKMRTLQVTRDHLALMSRIMQLNARIRTHQLLTGRPGPGEGGNFMQGIYQQPAEDSTLLDRWMRVGQLQVTSHQASRT